jgi:murein DD-endopeptidase MepM/ murein hydrolase activator NlpD
LVTAPFSAPSVAGLAPLTALDRENDDLQARIAQQQACQSQQSTSSLNPFADVLPGSHISSAYGQRIHPIYHLPQFHRGVDLAGGSTLIRAFAAGTVIQVESRLGYGTTTVIDHGGRLATVYAHQSATKVKVGDVVVAGQVIGVVGHTGFATGPHLHFEMRLNGVVTDPTPLVPGHAASGGGPVG